MKSSASEHHNPGGLRSATIRELIIELEKAENRLHQNPDDAATQAWEVRILDQLHQRRMAPQQPNLLPRHPRPGIV